MMKTIPQEILMEDGLLQLIDGYTEKGGGCSREFCEKADRKGG